MQERVLATLMIILAFLCEVLDVASKLLADLITPRR